ncbi:hypothetical protein D9756_000194 [Leucocoprinus leucothites]|uniref:F-box domain-containing protein n=1 Tax=Leucocoprinus leucothites TaxID=201217 RepID=A0A8H5LNN4_9AGAR|nr:hypothetical protein D9756_000194 [Leucoagaricus leucothites]
MLLEAFPVELIADILGELDLASLVTCSCLSRRLRCVASDPALNPWRKPILRNLQSHNYEPALKHLSVRTAVPRHNWIDILSVARPPFLLFDATLPNLKEPEWEECFLRRFLPGWRKWRKDGSWRQAFLKMLHRVWHRSVTSCTTDEAWTKYILLNRNGSANELQMSSRNFSPIAIFNELKLQNNLTHLETWRRVILELADVRIVVFGVLSRPKTTLSINPNAHMLLRPPGIEWGEIKRNTAGRKRHFSNAEEYIQDYGVYPLRTVVSVPNFLSLEYQMTTNTYTKLRHPTPSPSHANYPFYTPGGGDRRWIGMPETEEETSRS